MLDPWLLTLTPSDQGGWEAEIALADLRKLRVIVAAEHVGAFDAATVGSLAVAALPRVSSSYRQRL